jgi:hypothetical protein
MKNVKKLALFCLISLLSWMISGCAASIGEMRDRGTGTDVQLNKNNYKIVKAGAVGKSTGFNLLGFIPFASPNYADAKSSLYKNVGESLTGRSIALANQTHDRSTLYLILFSLPKVTITADVVEFIDDSKK